MICFSLGSRVRGNDVRLAGMTYGSREWRVDGGDDVWFAGILCVRSAPRPLRCAKGRKIA